MRFGADDLGRRGPEGMTVHGEGGFTMKIALIGVTHGDRREVEERMYRSGFVGTAILKEALDRGP
jgi:hypothetical protein